MDYSFLKGEITEKPCHNMGCFMTPGPCALPVVSGLEGKIQESIREKGYVRFSVGVPRRPSGLSDCMVFGKYDIQKMQAQPEAQPETQPEAQPEAQQTTQSTPLKVKMPRGVRRWTKKGTNVSRHGKR